MKKQAATLKELVLAERIILPGGIDVEESRSLVKNMRPVLARSPAIHADNVTEYFYAEDEKDMWGREDFPNCAPPFQSFWMETSRPTLIRTKGKTIPWHHRLLPTRWGALFSSVAGSDLPEHMIPDPIINSEYRAARWATQVVVCVEFDWAERVCPIGVLMLAVGSDGLLTRTNMIPGHFCSEESGNEVVPLMHPFWLALSFMHCKNVELKPHVPPRSERRRIERTGLKPLTYHVIEIKPMQKVLKAEGRSHEIGVRKALHVCRGHFKDYRQRGLFGQHKGLYWWDSYVRGTDTSRVVVSDFKVTAEAGG